MIVYTQFFHDRAQMLGFGYYKTKEKIYHRYKSLINERLDGIHLKDREHLYFSIEGNRYATKSAMLKVNQRILRKTIMDII